ncbi:hypothetical protein Tb10.389.0760 [Trypanosoma brucei brucei TREU927]|uniref:T. brucei spp.-specific protein n=1 Tax=Trypanosoma brucei brucei (strain 927/4 GUTat10.1) TaxID=185431 RepID=Q388W7_TRYB2|nr:hypothetical protein Tb10.389.0760 [Trypanosoma brucei brucei TREU927]EAN78653.1 hypothetical protein Tb10.389.0760 [Trypanosoma brucei brucei TREU927]
MNGTGYAMTSQSTSLNHVFPIYLQTSFHSMFLSFMAGETTTKKIINNVRMLRNPNRKGRKREEGKKKKEELLSYSLSQYMYFFFFLPFFFLFLFVSFPSPVCYFTPPPPPFFFFRIFLQQLLFTRSCILLLCPAISKNKGKEKWTITSQRWDLKTKKKRMKKQTNI